MGKRATLILARLGSPSLSPWREDAAHCVMHDWKVGDRVEHTTYGAGTVLEFSAQHAVIHFDQHGRRKFASNMVVLTGSSEPVRSRVSRGMRSASERTTDVGHENRNEQVVIRQTNLDGNLPEEKVYVLKCHRCSTEYGTNGCDIYLRRCPACMGGQPGLAVDQ